MTCLVPSHDSVAGLSGILIGSGGGLLRSIVDNLLVGKDPRGVLGLWNTMIDANEYWSPKQVIRYMHEIEPEFDIT